MTDTSWVLDNVNNVRIHVCIVCKIWCRIGHLVRWVLCGTLFQVWFHSMSGSNLSHSVYVTSCATWFHSHYINRFKCRSFKQCSACQTLIRWTALKAVTVNTEMRTSVKLLSVLCTHFLTLTHNGNVCLFVSITF